MAIDEQKVILICNILSSGSVNIKKFAKYMDVEPKVVQDIYDKKIWKEITEKYIFKEGTEWEMSMVKKKIKIQ